MGIFSSFTKHKDTLRVKTTRASNLGMSKLREKRSDVRFSTQKDRIRSAKAILDEGGSSKLSRLNTASQRFLSKMEEAQNNQIELGSRTNPLFQVKGVMRK